MIAVLGATGYVGSSLGRALAAEHSRPLALFARDLAKLARLGWPADVGLRPLDDFQARDFDLVINAIGAGDPKRVAAMGADILDITQTWDQRVLTSMGPRTKYVFLSSGAIYGASFERPAQAESEIALPVNRLETVSPYLLSKLYAEARHRHARNQAILDLRVFSFADPAVVRCESFFLAELARAVVGKKPFVTSRKDMIRDYAGVRELTALIACWEEAGAPNRALDLYTQAPVAKGVLIEAARTRYGLEVLYRDDVWVSPTGAKAVYASSFHAAADLGYVPSRDALTVVLDNLEELVGGRSGSLRVGDGL